MSVFLHQRPDGGAALYIDGNLQFDSSDEALYHESLVLPALHLAARCEKILICGGGDGLALRECLRFPGIRHVDIVDLSQEVVDLGSSALSTLNDQAFADPRVTVYIADAWDFLDSAGCYDAIVCDFTFPRSAEECRVLSCEWFERLKGRLAEGGVLVTNGVSPQATPEAFACLVKTVRAAGLATLPYRTCIPSFRTHGYGAWGFLLGSHHKIEIRELGSIVSRVTTRQADLKALARGARFSREQRKVFRSSPVNSLEDPCLIQLLFQRKLSSQLTPPDLSGLTESIPVGHPYHTKAMIETLAEQVVGSLRTIDLRKLIDALWLKANRLSERLREELRKLRTFVHNRFFAADAWEGWSAKLFAALLIVMTVANSLAPDNAFGKGAHGIGHSSFSRMGEFGHPGVSVSSTVGQTEAHALSGQGFRGNYGRDPVDVYGYSYRPRFFSYGGYGSYGSAGGGGGNSGYPTPQPAQVEHKPLFVADDDLFVMDDGSVVVTLSDKAYLLVTNGTINLMAQDRPNPIMPIYADPRLFQSIREQLNDQRATVRIEIDARKDWLSWVGWTDAMFPSIRNDEIELTNLRKLSRQLVAAGERLGSPSDASQSVHPPQDAVELFVGCYLTADDQILIFGIGGNSTSSSVQELNRRNPELGGLVKSVLEKMAKELDADVASDDQDLKTLARDQASAQSDLSEYQTLQAQNSSDPDYEVDYGTDSIPAAQAIAKTQEDLSSIAGDVLQTTVDRDKASKEATRMRMILSSLQVP